MDSNIFFIYSLFIIFITALIFCIIFCALKQCSIPDEDVLRSRRPTNLQLQLPIYDFDRSIKQKQSKDNHNSYRYHLIKPSEEIAAEIKIVPSCKPKAAEKCKKFVTNFPPKVASNLGEVYDVNKINSGRYPTTFENEEINEKLQNVTQNNSIKDQPENVPEIIIANLSPKLISTLSQKDKDDYDKKESSIITNASDEKVVMHDEVDDIDEKLNSNKATIATVTKPTKKERQAIQKHLIKDTIKFLSSSNIKIRNPAFDILIQFLKRGSAEKNEIIQLGVVPKLIRFLDSSSDVELQKLATEAILNVSIGTNDHKQAVFDAGGVPLLFKNLESSDHKLSYLTANALTMLLFGNREQKQIVIDFCETQILINLLKSSKLQICIFATFAVLHVLLGTDGEKKQELINAEVCRILVKHLNHPDRAISKTAAIALANITCGNYKHCQFLVEAGIANALIHFINLLDSEKCDVAAIILTNLTTKLMNEKQNVYKYAAVFRLIKHLNCRNEKIQFIALCVLEAISLGTLEDKYAIVNANGISSLVNLISPKNNIKICKSAIKVLEIIARGNSELFQAVLDSKALINVIQLLASDTCDNCELAVGALKIFVHESPDIEAISTSVPYLVKLLGYQNSVTSVVKILKEITAKNSQEIEAVINASAIPHLITFLNSPKTNLQKEVCETIAYISAGTDHQKQVLINNNAIPSMMKLLHFDNTVKSVLRTLSNLAQGNVEQREVLISAGVIKRLIFVIKSSDNAEIQNLAIKGLAAIADGTYDHKQALINAGITHIAISLLDSADPAICKNALNIFDGIIKGTKNQIHAIDAGAIPALQKLLKSHDNTISENASKTLYKLINFNQ